MHVTTVPHPHHWSEPLPPLPYSQPVAQPPAPCARGDAWHASRHANRRCRGTTHTLRQSHTAGCHCDPQKKGRPLRKGLVLRRRLCRQHAVEHFTCLAWQLYAANASKGGVELGRVWAPIHSVAGPAEGNSGRRPARVHCVDKQQGLRRRKQKRKQDMGEVWRSSQERSWLAGPAPAAYAGARPAAAAWGTARPVQGGGEERGNPHSCVKEEGLTLRALQQEKEHRLLIRWVGGRRAPVWWLVYRASPPPQARMLV